MIYFVSILLFSSLFMIKGGWLKRIPWWKDFDRRMDLLGKNDIETLRNHIVSWVIDGNNLSALILWVAASAAHPDFLTASAFAFGWWIFVISSMGEEAGAVGDYKYAVGPYITFLNPDEKSNRKTLGRKYGIKKSVILGVAGGSLMAAPIDHWWFMAAGATFPVVYFVGSSIYRFIHKAGSWAYAEPLYGVPFGIAAAHYYIGIT